MRFPCVPFLDKLPSVAEVVLVQEISLHNPVGTKAVKIAKRLTPRSNEPTRLNETEHDRPDRLFQRGLVFFSIHDVHFCAVRVAPAELVPNRGLYLRFAG